TVHWGIRLMLLVGTAFVTFDFIQLTFLAERTDRYFSWTIDAPITAVVLGSFYFAAIILTLLGGTRRVWVRTRAVVPGTWAFVTLVLLATLIHLDVFRPHMNSPDAITRFEFWVWIGAYTVEPVGLLIFGILQRRMPGSDPPRSEPPPPALYLKVGTAAGTVATVVGAALFLFPGTSIDLWSWPLTPLTARILGSWFVGAGLVMVVAMWERDRWRLFVPALAFVALGPMQLIGILRYSEQADWANVQMWLHLGFLAVVFGLGVAGVVMSSRAPNPLGSEVGPTPARTPTG
ncbi:MAG: hypothetical protein ACRDHC_12140, partial [Actinomycetota bacterium]